MANTVTGTLGGAHVTDGPLSTSLTDTLSPTLLLSEIDSRVVKVRPSATPIDQISRLSYPRRAGSMEVSYYAVDTKPAETTITSRLGKVESSAPINFTTANDAIFGVSETVMLPDVAVDDAGTPLVLYLQQVGDSGLTALPVNMADDGVTIPDDARLIRMGRAATELDVQTSQFEALPMKRTNYCQIFKAQIEQSTLQKLTNKEVGWTFSDQEEVAVIDMRMGMEKNFLFGVKGHITDSVKREDVMLTGGIWNQTTETVTYTSSDGDSASAQQFFRALMLKAFTGQGSSRRKILVGGSKLIDYLAQLEYTKVILAGETVSKWGIDFRELYSQFGSLYVVHAEVFDNCGHPDWGMVIDPQYLTKYSFIPMTAERLDLKRSGLRNTDAVVITEASCLVLRYPQAHLRIMPAE